MLLHPGSLPPAAGSIDEPFMLNLMSKRIQALIDEAEFRRMQAQPSPVSYRRLRSMIGEMERRHRGEP
jgi:hypothetical protein